MEQQVEPQPRSRVGILLRNCRLRAGLDLAELAQSLRIRQRFLEAIENGRFEALPAPVYALGFVRCYAEQLGLDAEEIARRFKSEVANLGAGAPLHFPLPITAEGRRAPFCCWARSSPWARTPAGISRPAIGSTRRTSSHPCRTGWSSC